MVIICSKIFISLNHNSSAFLFHRMSYAVSKTKCAQMSLGHLLHMKTASGSEDGKDCLDSRCWGLEMFLLWVSLDVCTELSVSNTVHTEDIFTAVYLTLISYNHS